jgi:hypothetical protein
MKETNWDMDKIMMRLFLSMATIISLYVAHTLSSLSENVGNLNIKMQGVIVQLTDNSQMTREMAQKLNAHDISLTNHEIRLHSLERLK